MDTARKQPLLTGHYRVYRGKKAELETSYSEFCSGFNTESCLSSFLTRIRDRSILDCGVQDLMIKSIRARGVVEHAARPCQIGHGAHRQHRLVLPVCIWPPQ